MLRRTPASLPAQPVAPPEVFDRVLVLAPHPDDESIATGGMLAAARRAGAAVRVVIATSGENNPWAQRAFERRVVLGARARMRFAGRREGEALAALEALGIERDAVVFLRLPDQGLTHLLLRDAAGLCARLVEEVVRFAPSVLIAPSAEDLHPDHSALAVASELALEDAGSARSQPRRLAFFVHNPCARRAHLPGLALAEADVLRKSAAIARHPSQLVLRGGFLRSFAAAVESYSLIPVPKPAPSHPIETARWENGDLILGLKPRFTARALGPATLRLLPGRAPRAALTTLVPRRGGQLQLTEYATGLAAGRGEGRQVGSHLELVLPARVFAGEELLFLKLERRYGFFDEAGWVQIKYHESAR